MLIRAARPEDAPSVARVHVSAWQAGYRHLLPREYLAQLRPEERAQRYDFANTDMQRPKTIVAEDDGVIRGFATTAPARDADMPDCGELCALYVDPDWWGRGLGRTLLSAARFRLAEMEYRQAVLWVLAGNLRAERCYRADGWTSEGKTRRETIWGIAVDEVLYVRSLQT